MINKLILLSLKNKLVVILLVLFLVVAGIIELKELPIDAVPDITNNQVQIITKAPSFAAQDIELKVTFPIEQACSNIEGIKEIRSFSRFGLSVITVVFDESKDIYWARQQVAERLQEIQNMIPAEIGQPELAPITTGLGEIYQYVVHPEKGYENKYSLNDLREIQDWVIRRQILGVKGVADVSSFGGKLKQCEIILNPYQLHSNQISISDVIDALKRNNFNTGSAYIEKNSTAYFIRTEGLITSVTDIENILVKRSAKGTPVQIRDIARVQIGAAPRYGALVYTSHNAELQYEAVGGIVMMLKGENSSAVIERVKRRIQQIQNNLPEGLVIEPFLDRTKMVDSTIQTVFKNLLEGAIIVISVLILFLGNIKFGLLVASVIPLSMLFAVILMNIFKVSGNLMSLGALDFGLIVDGAVIIVESILHQVSKVPFLRKNNFDSDTIVFKSSSKMMNAAVFGQIIILIVYLPVLYFTGIEGKMFRPMAQTVLFALVGAFILSVTYVPVMASYLINTNKIVQFGWEEKFMRIIKNIYLRIFKLFFRNGKIAISVIILLFFMSIYLLTELGGEFMPILEEGDFAVETRLMTGSGLSTTIDYCKKASALLAREFPDEVENVVSKIGSGEIPTDPMPIENADMMVILKPIEKWKKAKSFDELAQKMQDKLQSITGITTSFQYPVQMRFNELIAGAKQDVVCKIFGENIDSLTQYAHRLSSIIHSINGVEGIYEEPVFGQPQVVIQLNRNKLAQYNIDIDEVNTHIKSLVAGTLVGYLYRNERKFDIVVRWDTSLKNMDNIMNMPIFTSGGNIVPLKEVADIKVQTDINQIQRENAKRRIIVGFNVHNRDVESVIKELKTKARQIHFAPGYYIEYGGSFENLESAKKRLMITVPIALILIFVMLYFSFSSVRLSLLVYTSIPMSIIGGIFFLYVRQIPFSVSAGVGFIALFGISVLNGIVLISEFKNQEKKHKNKLKIIWNGVTVRLRPVLMTATVASLGFLPMFLNTGIGANVQRPLATVVIGGLISSTILTLFVIPVLYYHFILLVKKIRVNKMNILFIAGFLSIFSITAKAQVRVTYQVCIDSALKNHPELQMQSLLSEYKKELIKTAWDISKTNILFQYGQYNGIYNDNAIQMQQSFYFPLRYVYQKQILKSDWLIEELRKELEKRNIQSTVGKVFFDIVITSERIKLFKQIDSIYTENLRLLSLQYQKGNISELEKNILSNLMHENQMYLYASEKEKNKLLFLLQLLTSIKTIQDVDYTDILAPLNNIDSSGVDIEKYPSVLIAKQTLIQQIHRVQLEKSKLFPDLNFGYTNQSLIGWGTDNVYYPASRRFQYIYTGIDIPLFVSPYLHKIKAEKKLIQMAIYEYEWEKKVKKTELKRLLQEYFTNQKIISHYKNNILPNIDRIKKASDWNYQKGNISFSEWTKYLEQIIQTELNYLNYVQQQNHLIFELQNYLNK